MVALSGGATHCHARPPSVASSPPTLLGPLSADRHDIISALEGVAARWARRWTWAWTGAWLGPLLALWLLLPWLAFALPRWGGAWAALGVVVSALAWLRGQWLYRRRYGPLLDVARELEALDTGLRTDLRSVLELSGPPPSDQAKVLRAHLGARVQARLERNEEELVSALPLPSVRQVWRQSAPLIALALVVAAALPQLWWAGWQALWTRVGPGIMEQESAQDQRLRLFASPDILVEPPAYTGLTPRRLLGWNAPLEVPEGSRVTFETVLLVPQGQAPSAAVETEAGRQELAFESLPEGRWQLRWVATGSASMTWQVQRSDGRLLADPEVRRVVGQRDQPPEVTLHHSLVSEVVAADEALELYLRATDDYGLDTVSLAWHFAGHEERMHYLPLAQGLQSRQWDSPYTLDLAPLGLQPRDEILLYAVASDRRELGGPQEGRSAPLALRLAAPDEQNLEALRIKEELFESLLERLGQNLAIPLVRAARAEQGGLEDVVQGASAEQRVERVEALASVHGAWEGTRALFVELITTMDEDSLSGDRERALVRGARQRLFDAERDVSASLVRLETSRAAAVIPEDPYAALAMEHGALMRQAEWAALLFRDLLSEHRADLMERSLEEMRELADRLRSLLQELQRTDDPQVRARIEAEIARLERRFSELMQQIRSQSDRLPQEHINRDGMRPSELSEQMNSAANLFDRLRGAVDSGDIQEALSSLDALQAELEGMSDPNRAAPAEGGGVSAFDEEMAALSEELTNLAELQRAIEEQTEALEAEARQAQDERMREQLNAMLEQLEAQVGALQERMESAAPQQMTEQLQRSYDEAQRGLDRLARDLQEGDVAAALEQAAMQMSLLSDLEWNARMEGRAGPEGEATALRRQASQGLDTMRSMQGALQRIQEQGQPGWSPQQRGRLDGLASDQAEAGRRVGALRQRLEALDAQFPGVGEALDQVIQPVQQSMEGAQQSLQQGATPQALRQEREALEGLDQARQALRQQMQRQRRGGQEGRRMSQERVDIPQDGAPQQEAFRRRVQEAMRQDAPDRYRDALRSYYENLVR